MMNKLRYIYRLEDQAKDQEMNSDPDKYISMFITNTAKTSCPWFKALEGIGNIKKSFVELKRKFFNNEIDERQAEREIDLSTRHITARYCPGIANILDQSIVVHCPADLHISIDSNGKFYWNSASNDLIKITTHTQEQFVAENNVLFKDKIVIKFNLPLRVSTDNDIQWLFLQPQYHYDAPWEVVHGVMKGNHTSTELLNINTFVKINENEQTDLFIPAGTPLCYIWFSEPVKLVHNNGIQKTDFITKFVGEKRFFYKK